MSNILRILKQKATFQTKSGLVTPQQLWDFPIGNEENYNLPKYANVTTLDSIAIQLEDEYNNSGVKSFIRKRTKKNRLLKDKLEFVLLVIEDKMAAVESASLSKEKREFNSEIDMLIAEKQKEEMKELSVKELLKLKK